MLRAPARAHEAGQPHLLVPQGRCLLDHRAGGLVPLRQVAELHRGAHGAAGRGAGALPRGGGCQSCGPVLAPQRAVRPLPPLGRPPPERRRRGSEPLQDRGLRARLLQLGCEGDAEPDRGALRGRHHPECIAGGSRSRTRDMQFREDLWSASRPLSRRALPPFLVRANISVSFSNRCPTRGVHSSFAPVRNSRGAGLASCHCALRPP
mmetsp:Transcript_71361/g.220588  ORF Transcript_71361/g.220588 Transcript_71361/m.220588 type:complete len:207 (-) Transcript_71361:85-705(-)